MLKGRNDDLIFNKIGYWYFANMIFNAFWLIVFLQNRLWSMILGTIIIFCLLGTCCNILVMSLKEPLGLIEMIVIRGGFSIYSGWVTAATILNVTFSLKVGGV
jgi:tryptophan-rich sensory protein